MDHSPHLPMISHRTAFFLLVLLVAAQALIDHLTPTKERRDREESEQAVDPGGMIWVRPEMFVEPEPEPVVNPRDRA